MIRRLALLGFLVSPFALAADQEPTPSGTAPTAVTTPPAEPSGDTDPAYLNAERTYLKGSASAALQQISALLTKEAALSGRTRVRTHNLRGLIFFQQRNLQDAVQEFEVAVQVANRSLRDTDSLLHLTRYNYGNALFQVNRPQDAFDTLGTVTADALDRDTRVRFHHLYGNILATRDAPVEAIVQYLDAANLVEDAGASETYLQKATAVSKRLYLKNPKADLERIAALNFDPKSVAGLAAKVMLARGYMYTGEAALADTSLLEVMRDADAANPVRAKAQEMLNDLSKLGEVEPRTIGILLPLSGKFGRFGRLCLNSVLLAFNSFEDMPEPAKGSEDFRLVIRDSGETPESAQERFDELVKNEKAIAVIGPLLSKQFGAVAQRAQEYGVPLLSLSQRVDAGLTGSFIFPVALSPAQQIDLIVARAVGVDKYHRFAILAPSDSFGESYVNLFWDAVEKAGAEVVGIERYEPKSTDFREEMKRLLGLDYPGARRTELEDLERRKAQFASTLKVKGRLRQRLLHNFDPKPVVDFDAVFIPDDPATVGQIAPSFAVNGVDHLPLLGINTWNTPEILQRAGHYLQHAVFVDGFFLGSEAPSTLRFVQDYGKYFHSVPGTIEAQAYDAGRILMEAIHSSIPGGTPLNRAHLRDQLLATPKYTGISGDYQFTEAGVRRSAHLLTIQGNSINELKAED